MSDQRPEFQSLGDKAAVVVEASKNLGRIADALETLVAFCHEMAAREIEQSAKSEADNMRRRAPG